jgi:Tol biopolymer transport system component
MNADGSRQRRLTRFAGPDNAFAWSPDGRRILFGRVRDEQDDSELWTIGADGSSPRQLTDNAVGEGGGDW